jgi:site-specific DNA-methyltransferase (adenine-specific)
MEPVIVVGGARVFHGDCREVLEGLPDNSVDSIVTDPPYELGFMGKRWDSSGIAYDVTVWAECLRVLKPGGHILAFGGSRTWHRLAVAVEDAGFELRDSIAWIYGSGFPKSLDVSKAIDKKAGVEREILPQGSTKCPDYPEPCSGHDETGRFSATVHALPSAPSSSEAKEWEGWGTALKPAHEPVVVGRKPLVGTVAENVLLWGVGGLNIDGSRIASSDSLYRASSVALSDSDRHRGYDRPWKHDADSVKSANARTQENSAKADVLGRWPANVIFDEVTAGLLDEQSGVSVSKSAERGLRVSSQAGGLAGESPNYKAGTDGVRGHNDTGGASRFFYVAKASKRDRNEGLEELNAVSAGEMVERVEGSAGMNSPRAGAGRTSGAQNFHPTVKPTALMRYLIKLVTPAGGTVLDPFTGSGSTGKAALLDGFSFVGVELTEEYLPIIEGRLRWATEQGDEDVTLF